MERPARLLVVLIALGVALVGARPYAGSWNDGSRLATVEALVDHGTLAIDDSIFVALPEGAESPYRGPGLDKGTQDKLLIDGRYFSDKSPLPALLMAVVYWCLQWLIGLKAALQPGAFCWWMTITSSGVAYLVAVMSIFQLGSVLKLPLPRQLLLTASFGLATVAVVYVQHVNNHIMLLGVTAALVLQIAQLLTAAAPPWRWWLVGCLTGLGYAIDLGVGPPLLLATGLLVLSPSVKGGWLQACLFALGAMPWLGLHHAVNFAVGGTLGPANSVPDYFQWEGCPFQGAAMTGSWHHAGPVQFVIYAASLLFGKRGFVGHNMALFLLVPAVLLARRGRPREWPVLLWAAAWSGGAWLLYAAASRNSSGACLTIRWLVPLLAPGYYALALLLKSQPRLGADLALLSGWGAALMALAWSFGPWILHLVPWSLQLLVAALASWALLAYFRPAAGVEQVAAAALRRAA